MKIVGTATFANEEEALDQVEFFGRFSLVLSQLTKEDIVSIDVTKEWGGLYLRMDINGVEAWRVVDKIKSVQPMFDEPIRLPVPSIGGPARMSCWFGSCTDIPGPVLEDGIPRIRVVGKTLVFE